MKLSDNEMEMINGGSTLGTAAIVVGILSFLVGLFEGYYSKDDEASSKVCQSS